MANQRIDQLNTLTESTIESGDLIPVYDVSASETKAITKTDFDQSIGEVVDSTFTITDNADSTKKVRFQASGVTTGTTRTLTVPDADTTLVGTATTQTLTNKTIDPSLNTIDGDKLDISFVPTNYTRTDTAETDDTSDLTAHLKGIDNVLANVDIIKELPLINPSPFIDGSALTVTGSHVGLLINASGDGAYFEFAVPEDFVSLTEANFVFITATAAATNYSVAADFGAAGEAYNANSDSTTGSFTGTLNQLSEIDASAALTAIAAADQVGITLQMTSTAGAWNILGLKIRYATS